MFEHRADHPHTPNRIALFDRFAMEFLYPGAGNPFPANGLFGDRVYETRGSHALLEVLQRTRPHFRRRHVSVSTDQVGYLPTPPDGTLTAVTHRASPPKAGARRAFPAIVVAMVAAVWGVTFTVVDGATDVMPPADLVAWRFGLGALVLLLVRPRGRSMPAALARRAVILGSLLGCGFLLQAWAMTYTDAMMSGFLTGLLVVIAPVVGWLIFRDRVPLAGWAAVATACVGLAVLGWRETSLGPGEILTLLAATAWGVHLVLLARWAQPAFAIGLARIQLATVAGLALAVIGLGALSTGRSPLPSLPPTRAAWMSVVFLALIASAAAMVALSWAQSRMSATRAAVILTLEPAAAGITAAVLGVPLDGRTVIGGSLLIAAMLVVELPGRPRSRQHTHRRRRSIRQQTTAPQGAEPIEPESAAGSSATPAPTGLRIVIASGFATDLSPAVSPSTGVRHGHLDPTVNGLETHVGEGPH